MLAFVMICIFILQKTTVTEIQREKAYNHPSPNTWDKYCSRTRGSHGELCVHSHNEPTKEYKSVRELSNTDSKAALCQLGTIAYSAQKNPTMHQVTTMLVNSTNDLLPGHNDLVTTSTNDSIIARVPMRVIISEGSSVPVVSRWS